MSSNKKMIKFYSALLFISLIITYIVSINKELKIIAIDSPYISNEFCFAIASGILTGLIVALAAELRQYYLNKQAALNMIFYTLVGIYGIVGNQKAELTYFLNNPEETIPHNMSKTNSNELVKIKLDQINFTDYSPFSEKDKLFKAIKEFKNNIYTIEEYVNEFSNIDICRNNIQIEQLENGILNGSVNSSYNTMKKTLTEVIKNHEEILMIVDNTCSVFYNKNQKKFNWKEKKEIANAFFKNIEKNAYYIPDEK